MSTSDGSGCSKMACDCHHADCSREARPGLHAPWSRPEPHPPRWSCNCPNCGCRSEHPCAFVGTGAGESPTLPGTAAATADTGISAFRVLGRLPLLSQSWKCLLPLPGFSLLSVPALISKQSQGQALAPSMAAGGGHIPGGRGQVPSEARVTFSMLKQTLCVSTEVPSRTRRAEVRLPSTSSCTLTKTPGCLSLTVGRERR